MTHTTTWLQIFNPANYQYNPWALPPLIGSIYIFLLGLFVYSKNPRKRLNFSFALTAFVIFMWQLGVAMMLFSKEIFYPIFWSKFIGMGVVFIDSGLYLYTISLCQVKEKWYERIFGLFLLKSLIFGYLVLSSDLILADLRMHTFGYYLVAGKLHPLYLALHIPALLFSVVILIKRCLVTTTGLEKLKIKYIMLGFSIFVLAAVDYIPMYTRLSLYPFGDIFVVSFVSLLFYGIVRYRAMEIDSVIHRTLLWGITSAAVFAPIFATIYFSRDLIRNMSRINLSLLLTGIFFIIVYYNKKAQPKIDHIFRRRKYDYQAVLGKVAEKISTTIDIEGLTRRLLIEVCETMYVRNGVLYVLSSDKKQYVLMGRRGYKEVNGLQQQAELEIFNDESRDHLSIDIGRIDCDKNIVCRWINEKCNVLEKEQIEVDPQYEAIKKEALDWFREQNVELIVPLVLEHKITAILGLGKKENLGAYTAKDIDLLKKLGEEAGVVVFNALHYKDLAEKERLDEELKLGREIQMNLLPRQIPEVPNLCLRGLMTPAKEIGGDYYDFISLSNKDELAIVIGDVSGKGVAAGLLMSMVKASIHAFTQEELSPKKILLRTNAFLHKNIGGQKFMTLLYLKWQPQSRVFTYCSAGHEHVLIYRCQSQEVETVQSGGFMLGMLPDIDNFLEEKQIQLNVGDKILLYTDGVTEAENQQGERFGLPRLQESFRQHSRKPVNELMQAVKDEVYAFIGNHPQYDDITLVVMEAK